MTNKTHTPPPARPFARQEPTQLCVSARDVFKGQRRVDRFDISPALATRDIQRNRRSAMRLHAQLANSRRYDDVRVSSL